MSSACPDFDPDAWGRDNRVTVYPGKVQHWILAYADESKAWEPSLKTDQKLRYMAALRVWQWFGAGPTDYPLVPYIPEKHDPYEMGPADGITFGVPSRTAPVLAETLQIWSKLPGPLPLLRAGPVVYLPVQFAWQDPEIQSLPWPTHRNRVLGDGPCPVENTWMLVSVGGVTAGPLPVAPKREDKSIPDQIGDRLEKIVDNAIPTWVGLAVATLAVGYMVNSVASLANAARGR